MTRPPLTSLRVLLPHLRPYLGRAIAASLALLVAAGLLLGLGQGLRQFIDQGFGGTSPASLNGAALAMFLIVAALGASTALRFYLVSWLGERVAGDLRRAVFNHVLSLSPAYFETARTGDILSRLTADIAVLQALVGTAISQSLRNILLAIGAASMLVITSAKLAAITLVVVPVVVLPLILFGRRERKLSRSAQERVADLAATAEETINGLATVQAFTHEAADRARFSAEVERSVGAALRRILSRAILILIVILLGFGAITFSLWVGGRDVIAGRMTGGELSAFVFYAVLLASSLATISEIWGEMQRAAAAADRLLDILATKPEIAAPASPAILPPPQGRVAFEGVRFHYPSRPDTPALSDITLALEPGETVALVGPSGAGKTTVLQLLLRFRDPQAGRVLVDGTDIRLVEPQALRGRLGLVAQEPMIFSASVAENIRYGRPEADDAAVLAAAWAAAAADFIAALPQGMETHLGARGVTLSGGQRQRIAIARTLLVNPPVLILDDATSAIDVHVEAGIYAALNTLLENRTTLVIAHRISTIALASRVILLDQGRVVATGTHEELLANTPLYSEVLAQTTSEDL